jgi:DNA-binding NarL/FixJ family response regulator
MRVLLAEDHRLVRAGIRALLSAVPAVDVVAEADDGREALRLAHEKRPDLVLMDISMPGMNGLEAAQRISKELPEIKVIIVSMHANEEFVFQALRAGASGYLLKHAGASELEVALETVMRGRTYLSPSLSMTVKGDPHLAEGSPLDRLTPRQREILQLIAEGETNRGIAQILGISVKTVDTHRTLLMHKLDIHDVAGLVRYAVRVGLIFAA